MRAVAIDEHGGVEKLKLQQLPEPELLPGHVRVVVKACALNHLDIFVRKGLPHLKLSYPHILGCDIAGMVERVGPGVEPIDQGTPVLIAPGVSCGTCEACLSGRDNFCRHYGILGETCDGGYAEMVSVPAANLLPYPGNLDFPEAAAIPLTFQTAWQMLVDRAQVRPGEVVVVLAGGSGVGSAAIQIAKLFGATVIATASSEEKCKQTLELGADHAISHADESWSGEVRKLTGKRGADVVLEHVGTATWEQSVKACATGGRIVTCGATTGFAAKTDLRHVFFRQLSILGSTMGSKAVLHEVIKHVLAGKLRPVVDRVLPLSEAAAGHTLLEERRAFGKVVLAT